MVQSLSMDLRSRLLAAVDDGMSCRGAAARFDVARSAGTHSGERLAALHRDLKVVTCVRGGLKSAVSIFWCPPSDNLKHMAV
jgi:hypothetical protein